jgi:uncharacterized lipoprotein YbaY
VSEHDDRLVRRVVEAASGRDAVEACPDAEVLGLYAERGLDGDERAAVETHVVGCARCQAAVAAFVRSAPDLASAGAGALGVTGSSWWTGWRWLVPVTATAAVVTIAVWTYRPSAPSEPMVLREEAAAPAAPATEPAPAGRASTPDNSSQGTPAREAAKELASRRDAPSGQSRDQFAAGTRPAPPATTGQALAKQTQPGATNPPVEAEVQEAVTLADARERTVTTAAPPPAPIEARQETAALPPPAAAAVAPQPPVAGRAAQDAAGKPADTNRAKASAAAPAEGPRENAAASRSVVQGLARGVAVTGRVTYRTRDALPAGAVVEVRLLDVSRMDVAAVVLGRAEVVTRGEQVPVSFAVPYDPAAIDPRGRYTVQATITVAGRVAYRTTTAHPVLTGGAPAAAVEVVVEPLR